MLKLPVLTRLLPSLHKSPCSLLIDLFDGVFNVGFVHRRHILQNLHGIGTQHNIGVASYVGDAVIR